MQRHQPKPTTHRPQPRQPLDGTDPNQSLNGELQGERQLVGGANLPSTLQLADE